MYYQLQLWLIVFGLTVLIRRYRLGLHKTIKMLYFGKQRELSRSNNTVLKLMICSKRNDADYRFLLIKI